LFLHIVILVSDVLLILVQVVTSLLIVSVISSIHTGRP
jgi:hypothetical protein